MQSYDAPMDAVKKLSVGEKSCQIKGKENCMTASTCLQQKLTVQNAVPRGPQQSKLPVLSKSKAPPDFQKMHQTWQTHFQKGKAVCKKSCTRPQPFNFSQRGERSRVQNNSLRVSGDSSSGQSPCNSPASCKSREPLAEVVLGQNKKESSVMKVGSEVDFKADPAALASILSNIGVSAAPVGKVSLAQRVPMRAASMAHPLNSNKNVIPRSSMYTLPSSHTGPANLDRMSCFSRMTIKGNEQKSLRSLNTNPIPKAIVKEPGGLKKDELPPQENPVLQQMNPPPHLPTSDEISCSLNTQGHSTKLTGLPAKINNASTTLSTPHCETSSTKLNGSAERQESVKKTDTGSVDFVADSQALASILSNTELNNTNSRKLSLAQRVPIQGKNSVFKSTMTTPKPACGSMSATVPLKDLMFSPCRVPLVTSDKSSGGSARRVLQPQSFNVFSRPYCVTAKQPVFPKTPKAMALEKANKSHENDKTVVQTTSKSTVKWADELSPSPVSEVLCEREPDIEEVAMRLFLDGEGTQDSEKKKEPTAMSDSPTVYPSTSAPEQKEVVQSDAHCTNVGNFQLHSQMHFVAPSSQPSTSVVPSIKSSLPLSFLAHPAVQALQSCSLGPCSLPDIARLRLQAAVSAKQRFWEARLDEECAFYTSRGASGSVRSCRDPVSLYLEKQEDMNLLNEAARVMQREELADVAPYTALPQC